MDARLVALNCDPHVRAGYLSCYLGHTVRSARAGGRGDHRLRAEVTSSVGDSLIIRGNHHSGEGAASLTAAPDMLEHRLTGHQRKGFAGKARGLKASRDDGDAGCHCPGPSLIARNTGASVSAKMQIPLAHVEAGLRSRDRSMPEELNRLVTDQLADLLLTPSVDANENLRREGIAPERIFFVGNVMIDSLLAS